MVGKLGELRVGATNIAVLGCTKLWNIGLRQNNVCVSDLLSASSFINEPTYVDVEAKDGILLAGPLQARDLALNLVHRCWRSRGLSYTGLVLRGVLCPLLVIGGLPCREGRLLAGVVLITDLRTLQLCRQVGGLWLCHVVTLQTRGRALAWNWGRWDVAVAGGGERRSVGARRAPRRGACRVLWIMRDSGVVHFGGD